MRAPVVPEFRLRFSLSEVERWAARYEYEDDDAVIAAGAEARQRGWYTRAEFLTVTDWKTSRSKSRVRRNSAAAIKDATRMALATSDERLRIGVLTLLQGVEMPTASVLLHLAHLDPYPILDVRAIWSLGVEQQPSYYPFEFWMAYTVACRALAREAGVDMRALDRALWQYSSQTQRIGSEQTKGVTHACLSESGCWGCCWSWRWGPGPARRRRRQRPRRSSRRMTWRLRFRRKLVPPAWR